MFSKWKGWIVDRFGLGPIWENGLRRRVPTSPWYFGDGATLVMLLGLQVVTGAFMALTYSPSPETAYESVRYITDSQLLGWLVRALHYWGAGLMVVMVVFHVLRQIFVGGYKSPREGTWLVGVFLFFGVLVLGFTGYTLRWDERAVSAILVVQHLFSRVPLIGEEIVVFVQGGVDLNALTLTRLYGVHVILVPLLVLALAGYHLYLVVVKGTTAPAEFDEPIHSPEDQKRVYEQQAHSEEGGEWFYPETWFHSSRMVVTVFVITALLAILVGPQELGPRANLDEVSMPREEWWFWWYSALIALLPRIAPVLMLALPVAIFLAMLLLPFLDRSPYRGFRKRPVAVGFVVVVTVGLLYLSTERVQSDWTGYPEAGPPVVPEGVTLTEEVEEGRLLFGQYGCSSCHAVAGRGAKVGPDLSRSEELSREEIREIVLQPPEDIPMPSYEGRMTEEELARVVEFVHVAQTWPRDQ